jgi:hypothetical protein
MNPVLKAILWASAVECASVAMLLLGGFGPCGPSNPLGLIAMLLNIFPGAMVVFGLQAIFKPNVLNDTVCEILAVAIQLGFFWLIFYWRFRKSARARLFD